jgi:hypothetical protein
VGRKKMVFAGRFAVAVVLIASSLMAGSSAAVAAPADCEGRWFWSSTLDLAQGFWSEGWHRYQLRGSFDGAVVFTPGPVFFRVTPEAPVYRGQAQLRFYAVRVYVDGSAMEVGQLSPEQDTYVQVSDDLRGSKRDADAFAARQTFEVTWDGGAWTAMPRGPVLSFCAFDPLRLGVWERQWGPSYP